MSVAAIAVFILPLIRLAKLALDGDKYSQILIVPVVSLYFLFRERKSIKISAGFTLFPAILFWIAGVVIVAGSFAGDFSRHPVVLMDFQVLAFIAILSGGIFFFYGFSVFTSYPFPWLFLLLLVPIPTAILAHIISFFQHGSAEVVDILFQLLGMNYIRDGLTFHFPTISIYIATECSGIRSSTALLITGILAGHLFLRSSAGKIILMLCVVPLTFIKNGIRITTLTILADRVDHSWLTESGLHSRGGIVFFGIILLLLFAILFLIRSVENRLIPLPDKTTADTSG